MGFVGQRMTLIEFRANLFDLHNANSSSIVCTDGGILVVVVNECKVVCIL